MSLTLTEYQKKASGTAVYPGKGDGQFVYPALGLAGETGEVMEKLKKMIRDGRSPEDVREELSKELGDVLWYLAMLSYEFNLDLGYLAQQNLDKLASRAERGVLSGDGDNR